MKKILLSTLICLISYFFVAAQEKLHYWSDSETYLQDQSSFIIEEAYKVLASHPPGTTISSERKLALASLDVLMHDTRLDNGTAFLAYMNRMAGNVAAELQKNKPSGREIRYFRFYNHGFIVQTPSVTIAIDLIRGGRSDNPYIGETLMRSIVNQCDILFISHAHGDHADFSVVNMFCEQGKQVILPEEIWKNVNLPVRVMRGSDMIRETIHLPTKNVSLPVSIYPGAQGDVLNNVYIITLPEGKTIMHTGDQDFSEDLVTKTGAFNIDVLTVQCWMLPMEPFIAGVKPKLIITGHENEMLHGIDHREAYWLTFRRMSGVNAPYIIMAWGESYKIP